MAVTQPLATEVSSSKRNKTSAKSKTKGATNASENKKGSDKDGGFSSHVKTLNEMQTASLEREKIAEEIKLNVAAVGMDLLNTSNSKQPAVFSKVNNLIEAQVAMGAGPNSVQNDVDFADDEESPRRLAFEE